ncbi:MAG: ankyrin repeat domain-containing protein [Halomonas sp.]
MIDSVAFGGVPVAQANPLLISAAENDDIAGVREMIASDIPLDARDSRGRTALLAATHANRVETARLLISAGADVNAKDDIEDSPYLYAGARGHLEILQMTLSHGADSCGGTGACGDCSNPNRGRHGY